MLSCISFGERLINPIVSYENSLFSLKNTMGKAHPLVFFDPVSYLYIRVVHNQLSISIFSRTRRTPSGVHPLVFFASVHIIRLPVKDT
jgi:hypothetical protein